MAPKKKGNKKGGDDWEGDLGEDPIAAATQESKDAEAAEDGAQDTDIGGGGGLMAALKKNKANKKKKGKVVEEDWLDGEDPPNANGANGHVEPDGIQTLATKAPEEADANELFDAHVSKVKGEKGKQGKRDGNLDPNEDGEASGGEGGTVKSKKEKEKEKKEREKQRKKEQVCRVHLDLMSKLTHSVGCSKEEVDSGSKCQRRAGQKNNRSTTGAYANCNCYRDRKGQKEAAASSSCIAEAARSAEEATGRTSKSECGGESSYRGGRTASC